MQRLVLLPQIRPPPSSMGKKLSGGGQEREAAGAYPFGIRKAAVTMVLLNVPVCYMNAMLFLPGPFLVIEEQERELLTIHRAAGGRLVFHALIPEVKRYRYFLDMFLLQRTYYPKNTGNLL